MQIIAADKNIGDNFMVLEGFYFVLFFLILIVLFLKSDFKEYRPFQ